MYDMPKQAVTAALLAFSLFLLSQQAHAAELTKVRVSMLPITSSAPVIAADKLGYFKEEGLEIEVQSTQGGAFGLPALVGGSVDFAISNIVSIVLAAHQGLDLKVIAANADTGPEAPDTSVMVVAADSPIKSGADLAGKRVAINARNSLNWLYAQGWIDQKGGDTSKINYIEVPFPQMNDAVVNGQADAAYNIEPFVTRGTASGKLREIGRPFSEVQDVLPKSQFVTTGAYIESHPDVVNKFIRAYLRGVEWMNAHRGEKGWADMVAIITRLKPEIIMKVEQPKLPTEIDVAAANQTVKLMVKFGLIDSEIDFGSLLYKTTE